MITPQEILDWRENLTTAKIMSLFKQRREDLKEQLATGNLSHDDYKQLSGICEGYLDFLGVSYEYFVEEGLTKEGEEDVDSDTKYEDGTR